ncbi:hypothetical protein [Leptospira kobayashii]|nr:hypothetical protein [Leptospira kobayashii]
MPPIIVKMIRKFGQASILLGILFFSVFLGSVFLVWESLSDGFSRKEKFLEALAIHHSATKQEYLKHLEFNLREGELPYYGSLVGKKIKDRLNISSVKVYDESLRLVYSDKETKEVFQNELRHDANPLEKGMARSLANGEIAYRSKDGKFFITFPLPYMAKPNLSNPNLEFGYNFWVFDEVVGTIYYTNDVSVLNGDRTEEELLRTFQGKEGKKISWKIGGEEGILNKYKFKEYSVYIIEDASLFSKWIVSRFLLIISVSISFCFLARITYLSLKGKPLELSNSKLIGIISYLILITFYQTSFSIFPDFRYYIPWANMRLEQVENELTILEKNVLDQFSSGKNKREDFRNFHYDSVVNDVYTWSDGENFRSITDRFGLGIVNHLTEVYLEKSSRLLQNEKEYIFIIPINEENKKSTLVVLALNGISFSAKKEKDRDEYYYPDVSLRISKDRNNESFLLHPKLWEEELVSGSKHTESGVSSFSILKVLFRSYYVSAPTETKGHLDGLFIFKTEGVLSLVTVWSYITFVPLLLVFGFFKFQIFTKKESEEEELLSLPEEDKTEDESIPEVTNPSAGTEESKEFVPLEIDLTKDHVIMEEVKENRVESAVSNLENTIPKKEAIAELPTSFYSGKETVKKQIHQYIPPVLWKNRKESFAPEIQKKRESIFNPELKDLVQKVTSQETTEEVFKQPNEAQSLNWPIPEEKKFEYSLLDRVYRGDGISLDGIVEYTRNFISRLGSPRFSFLFLNDTIGSYHSQISFGLDYNTRSNMIFLHNDSFFNYDETGYSWVDIDEKVRQDKFISKKFSWEILAQIETIVSFKLDSFGFPGLFLVLLNKSEKEKFLDSHRRMIGEKLKQLIPALNTLLEKEEKTPDLFEDSLSWMVRSFLQATLGGKRVAHISRVIWENYHPSTANETKKASLLAKVADVLQSNDRVIESSPNSFLIISEANMKDTLEKLLHLYPFPYECKFMKYPDDGENYYLYL